MIMAYVCAAAGYYAGNSQSTQAAIGQ